MTAEVITLFETNCADIPAMLRATADNVSGETDEHDRTETIICLQVHESGDVQIYGWGRSDTLHCIAQLEIAKHQLIQGLYDV
jgi:hypothetical protein